MAKYVLNLYVTGQTPRALRAEANLRRICDQYLDSGYELTLIDILKHPDLAEEANIFATPATVRITPPPACRVIGDLSEARRVLMALGIEERGSGSSGREE